MAIIKEETTIRNLEYVIENYTLEIPIYQRPYTWETSTAYTLFNDIYRAYKANQKEYRIGTIIIHLDDKNKYNIVDGQQRLITLSLIIYILDNNSNFMLGSKINNISYKNIKENYNKLNEIIKSKIGEDEFNKYLKYIKEQCTFAIIITENEYEAFQFFDSQNSRGKSLAPHDLLKAYHLREMKNISEHEKENIINQWESIKEKELTELFADYLYPIIQWYKGKYGLYYNEKKIYVFKGISAESQYNFAMYHIFSNIFVEKYKKELSFIQNFIELNQFQLTQPVIAGERFFKYVMHYNKLLQTIKEKIRIENKDKEVPEYRTGDLYIKQLYISVLLFFVDRFGIKSLEKKHMDIIYKWSYALRLVMTAVYRETVNKYANNKHDRLHEHNSLFVKINTMTLPDEILNIVLMKAEKLDIKCNIQAILDKYNK